MAAAIQQIEKFKYAEVQKAPQEDKGESFEARLLKTANEYYDLTRASRARRYPLWLYADLFSKGIHYFLYDPIFSMVEEMSQEKMDECMYTPTPLLQQAVETIAAQYGSSNGKITSMPVDSSDPKVKAVVRGLREYVDFLDWKFYQANPGERQTECKLIPLRGVYNFVEFDKSRGEKIQLPQYEAVEKKVCADCGYEVGGEDGGGLSGNQGIIGGLEDSGDGAGSPTAMYGGESVSDSLAAGDSGTPLSQPACPHCGSTNIQPITAEVGNKGAVERRTGECVRRIFDAFQVEVYDRNRGIEESPYLICDDILFKTKAKVLYPHLKDVKGAANLGSYEAGYVGLHFLNQLQCLIGNSGALNQNKDEYIEGLGRRAWSVNNHGSFLSPLLCWRRRVWLDREVYADWTMGDLKAVVLPGRNEPIPPQTKVSAVFPDGLCFHIINGDCVVLTENQDKNEVWSFVGYRMPSAGLHGTGVNSLVSLVRGYDSANSFSLQALLMAALGIMVTDERVPKARNVPGSTIRIPQNARLAGESIQSLVGRLDMGGGAAIAAAEPIKESFRGSIGSMTMAATSDGGDLRPQGLGKDTATAVRYQAGATGVLVNPPLELYAAHRAKVIEQTIKLEKLHSLRPSRFGKFGDTVAKWFDASQIPDDVRFGAAQDSWRMRTLETEREDVGAAVQLQIEAIQSEGLRTKAFQVFGLDDDVNEASDWEVLAEKRLDRLKELAPEFEAMLQQSSMELEQIAPVDPASAALMAQELASQLPLQLIEAANAAPSPMDATGHPYFIKAYVDVYQSDEWDGLPGILKEALNRLWAMHQQGVGTAGAIQTEQQLIATEPARQAQKADTLEQQALQAESETAKQEGAMAMGAEEKERDRAFKAQEAEKNRANQRELAKDRK